MTPWRGPEEFEGPDGFDAPAKFKAPSRGLTSSRSAFVYYDPAAGRNASRTRRLADLLETASKSIETSTEPREFVAQEDRVLVVGFAKGKIKATNKTFEDDWIFAITVRDGRLTNIREYVDTQALARASQMDASGPA